MIEWLLTKLRKNMARPRVLNVHGGEVSLLGFPKDQADALQKHIESFGKPVQVAASPKVEEKVAPIPQIQTSGTKHPLKALGLLKNKNTLHWEIIVVGYDLNGNASVEEKIQVSEDSRIAKEQYKVKLVNLGII